MHTVTDSDREYTFILPHRDDIHVELMDENYLARMEKLRQMSSAIPKDLWQQCLAEVREKCTETAIAGFEYWGNHWNVEK